jgi:hypothetical protein
MYYHGVEGQGFEGRVFLPEIRTCLEESNETDFHENRLTRAACSDIRERVAVNYAAVFDNGFSERGGTDATWPQTHDPAKIDRH